MESFFRYIGYIDILEQDQQVKTAGYLIWKYQNRNHNLEIEIKDGSIKDSKIELRESGKNEVIGKILMDKGYGRYRHTYREDNTGKIPIHCGKLIDPKEIRGIHAVMEDGRRLYVKIRLPVTESENISCEESKIEEENKSEDISVSFYENDIIEKENITIEKVTEKERQPYPTIVEPMKEDKWEQLCKKYKVVAPFSSEVEFIMIKPEDFVILQEGYQKLVHNSFLLHGYYQYGHLILGKLEKKEDQPYYLGVPGIYYEAEKKAAKIFGFIGFEGEGGIIENGSYGYYMIEVKI